MKLKTLTMVPGYGGPFQICKDGKDLIVCQPDPADFFCHRYPGLAYCWDDAHEGEFLWDWGRRHAALHYTTGIVVTVQQWATILRKP